jgi:hypothetical protein
MQFYAYSIIEIYSPVNICADALRSPTVSSNFGRLCHCEQSNLGLTLSKGLRLGRAPRAVACGVALRQKTARNDNARGFGAGRQARRATLK